MASDLLASLWEKAGGVVPDDWDLIPFGELLISPKAIAVGVMYPGSDETDGVPLIRIGDVKDGIVSGLPSMRITDSVHEEYRRTELKGSELLITLVGNPGQCVIAKPHMRGWNVARAIAVARLKDPTIRGFLRAVFSTAPMRTIIRSMLNTTVQPTLNLKEIKTLPILMPPVEIREGIAAMLGAFDAKVALLRETNTTLEAIAQAIFKSWFVDFDPVRAKAEGRDPEGVLPEVADLFPCEFEDSELGAIPKGWRAMPFIAAIDVVGGGTPKTSIEAYWNGDIPWFSVVDAPRDGDLYVLDTEKHITAEGVTNSSTRLLRPGMTIISARGTVGKTALVGREMAMNQSCYGLQGCRIGDAQTYFATRRLVSDLRQRSHGSVFETITRDTLASVSVVVSPPKISDAFESYVGSLLERVRSNVSEAGILSSLRDTLLPRLMSGKLRIPIVEEVTA
jgi:type I restriction enzyme S subunit